MKSAFSAALLLSTFAVATPAAAANLIIDGGFNGGTGRAFGPAWFTYDAGPNRTADSLLRVQGQDYTNCCGAPGSAAARANFFATFGAGDSPNEGVLAQNFSTGAGNYRVSFDGGAFGGAQRLSFGIFDLATNSFAYQAAVLPTPTNDLGSLFQRYEFTVPLAGGNYFIAFANFFGPGTVSADAVLDNVSVAAVPESATWAMMILGMGMIGAGLRRRSARSVRVAYA